MNYKNCEIDDFDTLKSPPFKTKNFQFFMLIWSIALGGKKAFSEMAKDSPKLSGKLPTWNIKHIHTENEESPNEESKNKARKACSDKGFWFVFAIEVERNRFSKNIDSIDE